jgi:hypothetical protein
VSNAGNPEISDLWPRLLVSPFLGPLLATLSGLVDTSRYSTAGLLAVYVYFSAVAFVIWTGTAGSIPDCLVARTGFNSPRGA